MMAQKEAELLVYGRINDNVYILDLVLYRAKTKLRETHLVALDLVKAFDSISHVSILRVLASWRADRQFV